MADATKLGRVAFATVATLEEVDVVVTDAPPGHPVVAEAARAGLEIVHADPVVMT